jgi:hypothetical protein
MFPVRAFLASRSSPLGSRFEDNITAMLFEPVWISSVKHLGTFAKAYADTPYVRRVVGAFDLPADFPYARGSLGVPWRAPLVMFSTGRLTVDDRALDFEATPWRLLGNRLHNLRANWRFDLRDRELVAIESFEFRSPTTASYNLHFVRIRANKAGVPADVLLSAGGSGPFMNGIRQRSLALEAQLKKAFPDARRDA